MASSTSGANGSSTESVAPKNVSPFFHTSAIAEPDSLAILHLKRDSLLPVTLRTTANDGYAEGAVTNTRFGSYPHSTLIGAGWGSQIRASKVDTGSRGRKPKAKPEAPAAPNWTEQPQTENAPVEAGNKRKLEEDQELESSAPPAKKQKAAEPANDAPSPAPLKAAVGAGSGFMHVLPPTPESWTYSLDHRTQVVYTPDYSYILQRLRVKPGNTIIEAGAGSGSFTHAAARAVFNGYHNSPASSTQTQGRVCSFEYHEPRVQTLRQEIQDHGLTNVVTLTHRDVYNDGFLLSDKTSPNASAIFLDLPAPHIALKHLSRENPDTPLDPNSTAHICTFSPCIEQVTATVSALRKAGWTEIQMVEVANRRIDVRRERVGLREEGLRGVNPNAANVEESLARLREVDAKLNEFHATKPPKDGTGEQPKQQGSKIPSKAQRLEQIRREEKSRKLYKEGRLVHRTEPEVKTHTSYLVFAVLPKAWTEEDERKAREMWASEEKMGGGKAAPADAAPKSSG